MKVEDQLHISVDGVHVSIDIEARGGLSAVADNPRPRWKEDYAKQAARWATALETVRDALQELDDDERVPAGISGMGLGDVFVEIDRETEGIVVKEGSHEDVIGRISKKRLMELADAEGAKDESE